MLLAQKLYKLQIQELIFLLTPAMVIAGVASQLQLWKGGSYDGGSDKSFEATHICNRELVGIFRTKTARIPL